MQFLKLLLGFAPWLAFLFIAHGGLFRLKVGLVVALVLAVVMGLMRLHRGVILWVGLIFFGVSTLLVIGFEDMWTVRHMGVLANSAMALATWYTVAVKRPFTMDYARDHTPPELWSHPTFLRTNLIITSAWSTCFTLNAVLAWHKMALHQLPDWGYEVISYALLLSCAILSTWYPAHLKRQRAGQATAQ
jgi:hypothetical protein